MLPMEKHPSLFAKELNTNWKLSHTFLLLSSENFIRKFSNLFQIAHARDSDSTYIKIACVNST